MLQTHEKMHAGVHNHVECGICGKSFTKGNIKVTAIFLIIFPLSCDTSGWPYREMLLSSTVL